MNDWTRRQTTRIALTLILVLVLAGCTFSPPPMAATAVAPSQATPTVMATVAAPVQETPTAMATAVAPIQETPTMAATATVTTAVSAETPMPQPTLEVGSASPPTPLPVHKLNLPDITQQTLDNGLDVLVVPNHLLPTFILAMVVPGGESADPVDKVGVADLTASLLTRGTETRSAQEIASTVEEGGGQIFANADQDTIVLGISGLSEYADQAFAMLGDITLHATFPEQELANQRQQALTGLQASLANPSAIASRAFNAIVYGANPYGNLTTDAGLKSISREDVVAYYQAEFRPQGAMLVVIGDITPENALQQAKATFDQWQAAGAAEAPAPAAPPQRSEQQIYLVDRPGSSQATILLGTLEPTDILQDRYAVDVVNQVLGATSASRLFQDLREKKGYTYGISSNFNILRGPGTFSVSGSVRNEVVAPALQAILDELTRIRDEPVPDQELADAKSYLIGSYALRMETAESVAVHLLNNKLLGLPLDDVRTYPQSIQEVTQAEVQAAAQKYIHPDELAIVVVGDASQIQDSLAQVAPVTLVDDTGRAQ